MWCTAASEGRRQGGVRGRGRRHDAASGLRGMQRSSSRRRRRGCAIADEARSSFCVVGPHVRSLTASLDLSRARRGIHHDRCAHDRYPQRSRYAAAIVRYRGGATRLVSAPIVRPRKRDHRIEQYAADLRRLATADFHGELAYAHDCTIGNDVIFANCATSRHCFVGDHVFIGGLSASISTRGSALTPYRRRERYSS